MLGLLGSLGVGGQPLTASHLSHERSSVCVCVHIDIYIYIYYKRAYAYMYIRMQVHMHVRTMLSRTTSICSYAHAF